MEKIQAEINENTKPKVLGNSFIDPILGGSKVFDRNSLLAEIEENEKLGLGKKKEEDVEDNDFYYEKKENEYGENEKNIYKELYRNERYYEEVKRVLSVLKNILLKKKKKSSIVKSIVAIIVQN